MKEYYVQLIPCSWDHNFQNVLDIALNFPSSSFGNFKQVNLQIKMISRRKTLQNTKNTHILTTSFNWRSEHYGSAWRGQPLVLIFI